MVAFLVGFQEGEETVVFEESMPDFRHFIDRVCIKFFIPNSNEGKRKTEEWNFNNMKKKILR